MQTFLPYGSYTESARCLDNRRLNKQRSECKQILNALRQGPTCPYNPTTKSYFYNKLSPLNEAVSDLSAEQFVEQNFDEFVLRATPWYNHPATQMWKGHEAHLCTYAICMCAEWLRRGNQDSLLTFFSRAPEHHRHNGALMKYPEWITNDFCRSHQSNLIRKMPEYYGPMWPDVPNDLPYIWPTKLVN